jgi:8-amino-7-oxononanoate synthase
LSRFIAEIERLKKIGRFRSIPEKCDNSKINFSSNDYLGILSDKEIQKQFLEKTKHPIFGSGSSRLLDGDSEAIRSLEKRLDQLFSPFGDKKALVYNSGYHANSGIVPALTTKNDLIVSDFLNHASIIDGMRVTQAQFKRYKHSSMEHLESIISKNRDKFDNIFIITESIFSMDGDIAELKKIVELKKKYNCFLYVDEAHSFGTHGENGLGICEQLDILEDIDIYVATFGKAIGSVGAFSITSEAIRSYLINFCRTLIYSTALPPINCEFSSFILTNSSYLREKQIQLRKNIEYINSKVPFTIYSQVFPYVTGSDFSALKVTETLKNQDIHALAVRPPTVPEGSARVRFSLTANHTFNQLDKLIKNLV